MRKESFRADAPKGFLFVGAQRSVSQAPECGAGTMRTPECTDDGKTARKTKKLFRKVLTREGESGIITKLSARKAGGGNEP